MTTKPDAETDTIKHIRDRNNKNWSFHKSLSKLTDSLLLAIPGQVPAGQGAEQAEQYAQQQAARFTMNNKRTRFDVDHSILSPVATTGGTPMDRGAAKNRKNPGPECEAFKRRRVACNVGCPIKILYRLDNGAFKHHQKECDLCGQRGVSWMCRDCKSCFCFDIDRTEKLRNMLRTEPEAQRLRSMAPEFESLSRGNAPAYYVEIGRLKNKMAFTTKSCFHYCHPGYFRGNDSIESSETREDVDPLSSLGLNANNSPQASQSQG